MFGFIRNMVDRIVIAWHMRALKRELDRGLKELERQMVEMSPMERHQARLLLDEFATKFGAAVDVGETLAAIRWLDGEWKLIGKGPEALAQRNKRIIELNVRPVTSAGSRERVLLRWYRQQLRQLIPPLIDKWQTILGVHAADWAIKKMKTKWGSCSIKARRVWFNLELAKIQVQCLEYIAVHELVHLIERNHGKRFVSIMDQHLPDWRLRQAELNRLPLGHTTWRH